MATITMTTATQTQEKTEPKEVLANFDIAPADGLSLLRDKSEKIQDNCTDTILNRVDLTTLALYCSNTTKVKAKYQRSKEEPLNERVFSDHAFSQLCTKLGVPAQYLIKCMKDGYTDLAEQNLNTWVDDYKGSLLMREYKDRVRGVLSSRYSPFDTPDIIDVLHDTTRGMHLKLKGYFMNEERFHARLIQTETMNVDGEDLFGGIQIDSSDVGRSALTVNFFIYKQICTNGLCVSRGKGNLFHQKHYNICTDDFREELSNSVKLIPELVAEYEDIIKSVKKSKSLVTVGRNDLSQLIAENLYKAIEAEERDKRIQELIDRLKAKTKLQEDGVIKVLRTAECKYDYSDWGIVNAITEVAQDYTLERRIELEKTAANLLRAV